MLKTQHLRFLVAVVEYGGVSKAAERLHLSQPSVSAGLKALEDELGGALFDRSGPANRPLRLTPSGQRFYRQALEILGLCETARIEFSGESANDNKIRLGVLDTLPQGPVAETLRQFASHQTNTRLELWEGTASRLTNWFAQARIDVLWGNVTDTTPNTRILWREPLVAVVAPSHEYASTVSPISLQDMAKVPFVHRSNCEMDALGRARLKAAKVKLDVRLRAEREELAFQWIRDGNGITLSPRSLVPSDLCALQVTGLDVQRSIGLQWQEDMAAHVVSILALEIGKALENSTPVSYRKAAG